MDKKDKTKESVGGSGRLYLINTDLTFSKSGHFGINRSRHGAHPKLYLSMGNLCTEFYILTL